MTRAKPLSADEMLAALGLWGVPYKVYSSNWRTHNRNAVGAWGPTINGMLVHNFASDISDASSLRYLAVGDPLPPPRGRSLPGPLSQFALDDTGTVWIIGWGRANHGGKGDAGFFRAMVNDTLPLDRDYRPSTNGTVDLNSRTYGVEMLYGKGPTAAQRAMLPRLCAAMMHAHGYAATSVGGHREATTRRSDPVGFSMGQVRQQVAALLKAGPPKAPAPKPPAPKPPAPKPPAPALPRLAPGSRGTAVLRYQQNMLRVFPSYAGRIRANGGPNGIYGPATTAVTKEFQRRSRLTADGIVSASTWAALAKSGIKP